jgi:hypothetical protein
MLMVLMAPGREPLFTPRFFLMCGFTLAVFTSAFQLGPSPKATARDIT